MLNKLRRAGDLSKCLLSCHLMTLLSPRRPPCTAEGWGGSGASVWSCTCHKLLPVQLKQLSALLTSAKSKCYLQGWDAESLGICWVRGWEPMSYSPQGLAGATVMGACQATGETALPPATAHAFPAGNTGLRRAVSAALVWEPGSTATSSAGSRQPGLGQVRARQTECL